MMTRTPARAMAYVRRGMSGHATVEEATGMGINGLSYFCPFAKLLTLQIYCYIIPLYLAEMAKWQKISAVGMVACAAYGLYTLASLEHPHAKEVCVMPFLIPGKEDISHELECLSILIATLSNFDIFS